MWEERCLCLAPCSPEVCRNRIVCMRMQQWNIPRKGDSFLVREKQGNKGARSSGYSLGSGWESLGHVRKRVRLHSGSFMSGSGSLLTIWFEDQKWHDKINFLYERKFPAQLEMASNQLIYATTFSQHLWVSVHIVTDQLYLCASWRRKTKLLFQLFICLFYFCMCMSVLLMCISVHHLCALQRSEDWIPETGIVDGLEPPCMLGIESGLSR